MIMCIQVHGYTGIPCTCIELWAMISLHMKKDDLKLAGGEKYFR